MNETPADFALVMGIDNYGTPPGPLRGAVADALEFDRWLDDPLGGGVPAANRFRVLSPGPAPPRAIQDDIDVTLDELLSVAAFAPARRLYVFFAGHGYAVAQDDVSLCLQHWSQRFRGRLLSSRAYTNELRSRGSFAEVVSFFDCCRVLDVAVDGLPPTFRVPDPAANASTFFTAYSTAYQQVSFEGNAGGAVRGHFTRALLAALRGAAGELPISAARLKEYLELQTPILAREAGHEQVPEIVNALAATAVFGKGPPRREAPLAECEIRFAPHRTGNVELWSPNLELIRADATSTGPWHFSLPKGFYELRNGTDEKRVTIQPGVGRHHVEF